MTSRFTKALCLQALAAKVEAIEERERFDRRHGTSQLSLSYHASDELVRKAVEYGRMRALERFAEEIEEGLRTDGEKP
jgi:hypothetical protein